MAITGIVERGSILWMQMHPQAGHEQAGFRPAIVLSDGLIDRYHSFFAMIVPVTNTVRGYPFEVPVPPGITISGFNVASQNMVGVVLTDQAKTLDLNARNAEVVGKVDPTSLFFQQVITNVRSILA